MGNALAHGRDTICPYRAMHLIPPGPGTRSLDRKKLLTKTGMPHLPGQNFPVQATSTFLVLTKGDSSA